MIPIREEVNYNLTKVFLQGMGLEQNNTSSLSLSIYIYIYIYIYVCVCVFGVYYRNCHSSTIYAVQFFQRPIDIAYFYLPLGSKRQGQ